MSAIVALESTLIAHGLPFPDNLEVGRLLETTVRDAGAIPKTIAVLDGKPKIGLDLAQLERIARAGTELPKAGATDLAVHLARGGDCATTVSGTCFLAAREGIRVMATGGIGGAHRDLPDDVSHDLHALARLPICVVSSGAKAILDLPRTVEILETLGVLVVGYQTSELPAFYSRQSGIPLDHRAETPAELAAIVEARTWLGQGGVLVMNPIPEAAEIPSRQISRDIDYAIDYAKRTNVRGKALTPFLLSRIAQTTGGKSIAANRALAVANARLAAEIARALT
jgi:pseudouridine-5'-phosphate glycosidase